MGEGPAPSGPRGREEEGKRMGGMEGAQSLSCRVFAEAE